MSLHLLIILGRKDLGRTRSFINFNKLSLNLYFDHYFSWFTTSIYIEKETQSQSNIFKMISKASPFLSDKRTKVSTEADHRDLMCDSVCKSCSRLKRGKTVRSNYAQRQAWESDRGHSTYPSPWSLQEDAIPGVNGTPDQHHSWKFWASTYYPGHPWAALQSSGHRGGPQQGIPHVTPTAACYYHYCFLKCKRDFFFFAMWRLLRKKIFSDRLNNKNPNIWIWAHYDVCCTK